MRYVAGKPGPEIDVRGGVPEGVEVPLAMSSPKLSITVMIYSPL